MLIHIMSLFHVFLSSQNTVKETLPAQNDAMKVQGCFILLIMTNVIIKVIRNLIHSQAADVYCIKRKL